MKLIVNPHKIELIQEEAVNEKEIDISKCEFEFANEITNEYVKEAYFTLEDKTYKQVIVNNKCEFPQEVLVKPATIELGVVAYLVENNTEIKRYNPTPVYFKTDLGSLKTAQNSQPITPSEMEQYEQALQDGLSEINTAILEASNLNITAEKVQTTTYVTITDKEGNQNVVEIEDGEQGATGETGPRGPEGPEGPAGKDGVDGKDGRDGVDGTNGRDGVDGKDGISPTASVNKVGSTATITITDKNGTTTASISDGTNGTNGRDGTDGVGVPSGGTQGQVLAKTDGTDYNTEWITMSSSDKVIYNFDMTTQYEGSLNNADKTTISQIITDGATKSNGAFMINLFFAGGNKILLTNTPIINSASTGSQTYKFTGMQGISNGNPDYWTHRIEVTGTWTNNVFTATYGQWQRPQTVPASTSASNSWLSSNSFSQLPTCSAVPSSDTQLVNKKYVDDAITSAITTTLGGSY